LPGVECLGILRHAPTRTGWASGRLPRPSARVTAMHLSRFLIAALTAMSVSPAGAHAHLDRAAPAAGSTVPGSPPQLKLWFTERLEPAFSKVRVLDRNGKQVEHLDLEI